VRLHRLKGLGGLDARAQGQGQRAGAGSSPVGLGRGLGSSRRSGMTVGPHLAAPTGVERRRGPTLGRRWAARLTKQAGLSEGDGPKEKDGKKRKKLLLFFS
jgi:hypothetical protein